MSLLRTYSKFTKLSYHSARAFSARKINPNPSNSGFGVDYKDTEGASSTPIYDDSQKDNFSTQSSFDNRYQSGSPRSYSDNYSSSSYTSRGSNTSTVQDPISAGFEVAGTVAQNAMDIANAAGNFAKDTFDSVTGGGNYAPNRTNTYSSYDNRRGYDNTYRQDSGRYDNYRREQSPADLMNNAADNIASGINSAVQGLANVASSFIPGARPPYDGNDRYNDRYQDRYSYNESGYRGRESRGSPQYFTSSNPQFNSFNSTGPTSGFGASQSQDYGRNIFDETANNVRSFADQAANSAREFVDRGMSNTAANMANSTIRGFGDSAYTMASRFNPMNQGYDNYDNRRGYDNTFRQDSYRNESYRRDDYNRRDQNPLESAVNAAFTNCSEMARGAFNVASAIGSSFIPPGMNPFAGNMNPFAGNRGNSYEHRDGNYPNQSYSDQYVHDFHQGSTLQMGPQHFTSTNTQFNAFSTAAPVSGFGQTATANATDFASTAQNMVDSTVQNLNSFANQARDGMRGFVDQNAPYSSRADYARVGRNDPSAGDVVGAVINGAGNAVMGIAEGVFSIAATFIPGGQNLNPRNDGRSGFQGGSYNSRL